MLRDWDDLPEFMRIPEVRPYWEKLNRKRVQLMLKRGFDFAAASVLLILLAVPMIVIAVMIKKDSKGPVFYLQERVTAYGKRFRIHKFRTMVVGADKLGSAVTVGNDKRITKIGSKLRKYRIDELPQLFDVVSGNMSFVGKRPEVLKYVRCYEPEYFATLLLPSGITSEASIRFKDEAKLLSGVSNVDEVYVKKILPQKMKFNLEYIRKFNLFRDFVTLIKTVVAVLSK
ncbi:MAG: sugar transferase [Eubacterium sp.]|nr:sugar transferase [Eubacterium sp.]